MPYEEKNELPKQVKENLPRHAQRIYLKAYNSAWEQYADPKDRYGDASREEVAHKVAWSAVKQVYEKDNQGDWVYQE